MAGFLTRLLILSGSLYGTGDFLPSGGLLFLLLAITDFIYSGDSYDRLASIIYVSPLPETRYYPVERRQLKIILINVNSSAKYLAGKYQMRFFTANTFYKFVNQFSFIRNKCHWQRLTNENL
ncbi:hypothetical protein FDW92_09460 [Citrobacter sp. wls706]|nr:hypothetical protein FDW92_09460 [Citrobacter sp. wls706]